MRYLAISVAAVMAVTGAASLGYAQAPDADKGKGPAAEGRGPSGPSGGAERAPGGGDRTQQPAPNRAERKSEPGKGAQREQNPPRTAQPNDQQQKPKSTQGPKADKESPKSATQPQRDKDQPRTGERQRDQDKQKSATERQRDQDKQKSATDQRPQGKDQQKSADRPDQKQDRVQVSEQQRTSVRERLAKENRVERVKRTNINVSINVGTRLPRSVRLHTLPVAIVSLAPSYRSYSYFVLEDETICIVDPRTYVIVDVIPAGTQRADRPVRAHLVLNSDDMRFIYRTVPKERTANVRIRLALGAEVPRDIGLIAFPDDVIERVPDMRRYRYIVSDGEVVIIDPNDYAVALVINE